VIRAKAAKRLLEFLDWFWVIGFFIKSPVFYNFGLI